MDLQNLIKQFRFFFDIRGIETDELSNAPTGWRDLNIEFARSPKYSGLLRQVTDQLSFTRKAAYLLRREYAKYRLLAQVNLRIDIDTCQPMNTYANIYTGKIDFSKKVDKQDVFIANAKSLDFSQNIDAYDSQPYSIPLDGGINVEIPGLPLNETATLIPSPPPDGNIHSDYFPAMQLVNNFQNSIDQSAYNVNYDQFRNPDFSTRGSFFYQCRLTGKLLITGALNFRVDVGVLGGGQTQKLRIVNQNGTDIITIFNAVANTSSDQTFTFNNTISVSKGDRLYLYISISDERDNTGITINGGEIDLSYQTYTPPTMCQALTGSQLFAGLLQAMNVNQDSAPNQPVYYQSFLLANALRPLVFTCSDSIRAAQGSIYADGDTISEGIYKVLSGSVIYDSNTYTTGQQFSFDPSVTFFTGSGVVQKIQSIFVGAVYNAGDSLQSGATYLVGGSNDGYVTYGAVDYHIGETFKYILGNDSFTGSDDTMYIKQIAVSPQIIISFADFFQCIKSVQGGDCAFGVNRYTALNGTPLEKAKQLAGIPFIETLASVYKLGGGNRVNMGVLSKAWQNEAALDMMYNTISVGQKDQQYDSINGSQEVMSTQYYSSSLLTPVADLNLVSTVRFDPYGIEGERISMNDTAASRSDNNAFGFWLNNTPIAAGIDYTYYRPMGIEGLMTNPDTGKPMISGVDPKYYNYKLSPKTCLSRGKNYLASIFYGLTGQRLILSGYLKNVAMVYTGIDGVRISESEPVDFATLGKPYFIPEYYTDTISCPDISQNEYGDVTFVVNGYEWSAFAMNYKVNPAMNKPQAVKLLLSSAAINDLSRTVR